MCRASGWTRRCPCCASWPLPATTTACWSAARPPPRCRTSRPRPPPSSPCTTFPRRPSASTGWAGWRAEGRAQRAFERAIRRPSSAPPEPTRRLTTRLSCSIESSDSKTTLLWQLTLRDVRAADAGLYECQVTTHPHVTLFHAEVKTKGFMNNMDQYANETSCIINKEYTYYALSLLQILFKASF
nr:uncharacterized protein LOC113801915 [Penaeus vannamei]